MVTCAKCGNQNLVGAVFCSHCGTTLTPVTPSSASQTPENHPSELTVGTRMRDRYVILRVLARGGFGVTYLAEDNGRFHEKIVIKELNPSIQGTFALKKCEELFQREAQTLYQLQHPQIPKFREIFRDGKGLYLVQDFIEGHTYYNLLTQRLQQGQRFSEAEILELFRQVLPILSYLHGQGVIHRDISPDNIIRREIDKMPVLIDLGGVKQVALNVATQLASAENSSASQSGPTVIGKPGYAPDEQMSRGVVAPHSDLYSLAATALFLMTGKQPQNLRDPMSAEWLWERELTLSPQLTQALNRMLAVRLDQRFPSAQDVQQFLASTPLIPPPTIQSIIPPPPPPSPRKPWYLFGGLGIALFSAIALGFFWHQNRSQPTPTPLVDSAIKTITKRPLTVGVIMISRFPKENYIPLIDYLKGQLSKKLNAEIKADVDAIEIKNKDSLTEAKSHIANKTWDVAFTLTPMLSIAAQDNGYEFAARMFPSTPAIESALFVRADSSIHGLNDITSNQKIALGQFNDAFAFYQPIYDLYGKTINLDLGNPLAKIIDKVESGQVDVGAGINSVVKNNPKVRRISVSRVIPGAGVYLSPNLTKEEQNLVKETLLTAPSNLQEQANYAKGDAYNYTEFIKITHRVDEILSCTNLNQNPVNLFCGNQTQTLTKSDGIVGKINGVQPIGDVINLTLQASGGQTYLVTLPQPILNQIPKAPPVFELNGKVLQVIDVQPQDNGDRKELHITKVEQVKIEQ